MTRGSSQSVFDELTSAIVSGKRGAAKSAGLTPVGFEKPRAAPVVEEPVTNLGGKHAAMFPYDDPQTVHNAIREGLALVRDAKAELDHVDNSLQALGALYGLDDWTAPGIVTNEMAWAAEKAAEREADARAAAQGTLVTPFDERLAAQREAAQAAVFTGRYADHDAVEAADHDAEEPDIGWQCPVHGDEDLFDKVGQRTGRKYRVCQVAGCKQFQK